MVDCRIGKLLFWRHFKILDLITDSLDEKAFLGLARDDYSAIVATLQDSAMKVAGDVRMRAAFEEIARLVDGVKSIPDFAA